jgi:hypothetical protein
MLSVASGSNCRVGHIVATATPRTAFLEPGTHGVKLTSIATILHREIPTGSFALRLHLQRRGQGSFQVKPKKEGVL